MTGRREQNTETELKLAISPAGAKRVAEHAAFRPPQASEPKSGRIVTTYFDTPNRDLARRGLSLRVRRAGAKRIQTVKTEGDGGAAASRGEWEWTLSGEKPDLGLAAGTPIGKELPPDIDKALEPVVVTDVVRTTRTVKVDGTTIEAALDKGSIEAGDAKEAVHELELELRQGTPGALYRLALELNEATPLSVEVESKAARGYRLTDRSAPPVSKPSDIDLDPDIDGIDGFRAIVANGLGHLTANRAAARAGNAEGIHQTRVAMRRLRSALRLFEPRLETHATAIFQSQLQRMGRVIGEARDWDVFCLEMLPKSLDELDKADWVRSIRKAANARRLAAEAKAARELDAASFTELMLGLSAWIEEGREQRRSLGDKRLEQSLSDIAPGLLDRMDGKAESRARRIGPKSPAEELHPLRKSLKKLRYSVEFLGSLYSPKPVKRFLKPLKKLQQSLGVINDSATAVRFAERLAEEERVDLPVAVARLAHVWEHDAAEARRGLDEQLSAFKGEERFWR